MAVEHLVLLSGGIDSACLLADPTVHDGTSAALFVDYGQPVAQTEHECSARIASHYSAPWASIEINGLRVEHGEIPGRNALLAHLALTHLGAPGSACIYLAIHAGTPYRDCTAQFIEETQRSLDFQSGGAVRLVAPYVAWPKQQLIEHALQLGVPLELTHSCERSTAPCGECLSCIDREALLARL